MKKIFYYLIFILLFGSSIYAATDEVESLLGKSKKESNAKTEKKESDGVIIGLKGQVFTRFENDQTWKQALKGDKIKEKAILITMEDSEVTIKLLNETNATIYSKSRVQFTTLRVNPKIETVNETEMKLFVGKIYSNVKKSLENGSRYEIKTGSATAGVRGTQFIVWNDENGDSGVTVYKGIVAFGNKERGNIQLVKQNEKVILNQKGDFKEKGEHKDQPPKEIIEEGNSSVKEEGMQNPPPNSAVTAAVPPPPPPTPQISQDWVQEKFGEPTNPDILPDKKLESKIIQMNRPQERTGNLNIIVK